MRSLLLLALVCMLSQCFGEIEQVHVALTGKPDEMSIMWITRDEFSEDTPSTKFSVEYGYAPGKYEYNETVVKSNTYTTNRGQYKANVHETVLVSLKTISRVYYRIGDEHGKYTKEFSFATAYPKANKKKFPTFKFLSYGDMDTNGDSQRSLALIDDLIKKDKDIRFIIHQGDIPYAWSEGKWDTWGNMAEHVTANIPYMTTVGNHEENFNFTSYKNRFTNVTGENSKSDENGNLFYSFNYGGVHFVGLSSEHDFTKGSAQYKWLKSDLKKVDREKTPFLILYAHRPMYCSNKNHGSSVEFRNQLEPLLWKHKVDLFLFGHVHAYERTCPMFQDEQCATNEGSHHYYYNNPSGTIHLVIGTAGYEANPDWEIKPAWSVFRETSHGLLRVTVMEPTVLYAEFIRSDGSIADRFMIDKHNPETK